MKKIIKKIALILSLVLVVAFVFGCSQSKPTIGIIQFGSHASLNNCYDGIIKGIAQNEINLEDYNVNYVNSNFDPSVSQTQAINLVNRGAKVVIAIATPSAVAAANAAIDTNIPVVFCAVTDATVMDNYSNITGSSDIPNFDKQLELVTQIMGKSDLKIGVLYSTDESSSPVQISNLKEAAKKYSGMEIYDSAVAEIITIDTKVTELIDRGVDCFINILDNTIVGKLETNILPITNRNLIPVFGSEIEQVKVGCAASSSIEYLDVGESAGKAAAEILGGKSASEIPVATVTEPESFYNSEVCDLLGLNIPGNISATDVKSK